MNSKESGWGDVGLSVLKGTKVIEKITKTVCIYSSIGLKKTLSCR